MRSDLGLLRRVSRTTHSHPQWHTTVAVLGFLISTLISSSYGGPADKRFYKRSTDESFADFESKLNETHPEGTCFLDGILVPQATVYCEKKSGCRAIQKTGYCCPDYKCECAKDGKVYSNGEKLVDPDTPCKVCYCQGGEILCSSVTCYKRDDCQPKYIAGRCCPEYDNCPEITTTNTTSATPISTPSAIDDVSTAKPEIKNNPLGIKIKEITKPEEIRIVDDKPKPISPRPKPVDSSLANQLKIYLSKEIHQTVGSSSPDIYPVDEVAAAAPSVDELIEKTVNSPLTTPSTLEVDLESNGETVKIVRQTVPVTKDSGEAEEKEKLEEEVVIVDDQNGQSKPITIFGTKGLQRGDDGNQDDKQIGSTSAQPEVIYDNSPEASVQKTYTTDFDPVPSGSDNIYSFVISTEGPTLASSTAGIDIEEEARTETDDADVEPEVTECEPSSSSTEGAHEETTTAALTTPASPAPVVHAHHHHHHIDDDDTLVEANPAYPTIIEEDLSNYPREIDDYPELWSRMSGIAGKDESRSVAAGPKVNITTTRPPEVSTEGPRRADNETEVDVIGQFRSPGEPCLVPVWDNNSTSGCNRTDAIDATGDDSSEETADSLELDVSSGSGSGSSDIEVSSSAAQLRKDREPTTPKYQNIIAIDELGSGDGSAAKSQSPENDPKNDAESLKYDDGDDDQLPKTGGGRDIHSNPVFSKAFN